VCVCGLVWYYDIRTQRTHGSGRNDDGGEEKRAGGDGVYTVVRGTSGTKGPSGKTQYLFLKRTSSAAVPRQKNVIYTDGRTFWQTVLRARYNISSSDVGLLLLFVHALVCGMYGLMRCTTTTGGNRIFSGNSSCVNPKNCQHVFYYICIYICMYVALVCVCMW